MTLKELRMWHWRQVIARRKSARTHETTAKESLFNVKYHMRQASAAHAQADHHLSAVQALNDVVPGVAEYDCLEQDAS